MTNDDPLRGEDMRPEADRWLTKAQSDLEDARYLLEGARYEAAGFTAQQAVEKALKALIIEQSGHFPRIHDLVPLAKKVQAPQRVVRAAETLTPAYVAYRYPDVGEALTPEEARDLVGRAEEVMAWVRRRFS